jgi:serine/threonine-protein kinase
MGILDPFDGLPSGEQGLEVKQKLLKGLTPGDVVGDRYQVERFIGRGGMGMVYLVHDRKEDRNVALKTLLPQYVENENAVKRFVREVELVKRLNHPGIVKIYEAWRLEDILMYTMEYIEGKSLRHFMTERKRLGLGSTVRVLSLLCHALEHAHKVTIHRDLSPENVMVLTDHSIRLLDFGLAKLSNNEGAFTRVGISLGKMQYMAPEQRANATNVDQRADVYSLGVMFYEMLSGQLPKGFQRVTELAPGLPPECDALLEKALAPMADDRMATAHDFRKELALIYEQHKKMKGVGATDTGPPMAAGAPATQSRGIWARLGGLLAYFRNPKAGAR